MSIITENGWYNTQEEIDKSVEQQHKEGAEIAQVVKSVKNTNEPSDVQKISLLKSSVWASVWRGVSYKEDLSDIEDPQENDSAMYNNHMYIRTNNKWLLETEFKIITNEDLMIYDWYLADGNPKQFTWEDNCPNEFGYEINRFNGILITPEILQKNGFEKLEHYDDYIKSNDNPFLGYNYVKKRLVYHDSDYDDKLDCYLKCEYVHELQQLLRRFGFKDIADNFKI